MWPRPCWSTLRKWRIPRWSAKTHGGLGWGSSWRTSPRHYQGTGGSIAKPIRIHIRRPRVEEIKIEIKMQRRPEIEEEMFTCLLPISDGVVNYRTGKRNQTWQTCVSNLYNGFSASPASAKRCPLSTLSRNKSKFAPARRIPIWKMMKTENNGKAISKQTLYFSLGYHARSLSNHFRLQSGWKLKANKKY